MSILTVIPPLVTLLTERLPLVEDILGCSSQHVFHRRLDQHTLPGPHNGTGSLCVIFVRRFCRYRVRITERSACHWTLTLLFSKVISTSGLCPFVSDGADGCCCGMEWPSNDPERFQHLPAHELDSNYVYVCSLARLSHTQYGLKTISENYLSTCGVASAVFSLVWPEARAQTRAVTPGSPVPIPPSGHDPLPALKTDRDITTPRLAIIGWRSCQGRLRFRSPSLICRSMFASCIETAGTNPIKKTWHKKDNTTRFSSNKPPP